MTNQNNLFTSTLIKRRATISNDRQYRVLGRTGARELTLEETARVSGGDSACTFVTTHVGHIIDDLVDGCGPA
ncbi:MAG: hypothetical protein LAP21_11675 [Acidobacteriia bacterium]|nr:hypothetical protein [Terriglobia bacterium]